ncbi:Low-density lipoprotein receptor domain class A family protein [Acanthocheilonema viteae]
MILSSLSLSFSSILLLSSSTTVQFPERRIFLTVLLILPSLCLGTVTQYPRIQLNSSAGAQLPNITGHNLSTASKTIIKNRNSIIRQYHCPTNTFRCGDGSCIPQDWINDGEVDCDDLSDEKKIQSTRSDLIQPTILSETTEHRTTIEETFDDPFDHVVTFSSIDQSPFSISPFVRHKETKSFSSLNHGCSNAIQTRVNQCSTDLTDWVNNLDQIDLTNSSMLNDETR